MNRRLLITAAATLLTAGPLASAAQAEGTVGPFWSRPFPYGYVGTRASCEAIRPVETPYGIKYEKVWVCGPVLHARG